MLRQALGYVGVGGATTLLDVATLALLHGIVGIPLWLATTVAYLAGLVSNYALNRLLVFQSRASVVASGTRYLTLVILNYVLTVALVTGLVAIGVHYLVAKTVAITLTLIWNFVAYRYWVFATHREDSDHVSAGESVIDPASPRQR